MTTKIKTWHIISVIQDECTICVLCHLMKYINFKYILNF